MNTGSDHYPKVSVLVLNWNNKDTTIECVNSIRKLNYPNFTIVVLDNGSIDGSLSAIREAIPEITVIENGKNLGYARGFNAGLRYAYQNGADYFLILNNDTVIDPDALRALVQVAESDPCIGFVSGKVYFYDEPKKLQTAGRKNHPILLVHELVGWGEIDEGQYNQVKEYDFLDDIYLLVSRRAYEDTGGYDPNFFLYYEETDWCVRVRKAGYKLVYTPEAKLWHKQGRSTGGEGSPTFVYYNSRNQILFIRRNSSSRHFIRYLWFLVISSPRRLGRWVKRRRFDLVSAFMRGVGSGLLWLIRDGKQAGIYISTVDI